MTEKNYSEKIKRKLIDDGYFVLDLESIGDGMPDKLIINPETNKCCFVEFKSEKGKLRKSQFAFRFKNPFLNYLIFQKNGTENFKLLKEVLR
jgi:hypothetical protein